MTIPAASLIDSGLHHAKALGPITVGPNPGEIPAVGLAQLLILPLPFAPGVYDPPGFEDQLYVTVKSLDGNTTDAQLDAVPVQYDPTTGAPSLRLSVNVAAVPASVEILVEAHHSTGR